MAKYRKSLPERYLVAVDDSGVYLRETLLVNHLDAFEAVSGERESHYDTKPINWTVKRLHEFKATLAKLEYKLIPKDDEP